MASQARIVEVILSGGWYCEICWQLKTAKSKFETVFARVDTEGLMHLGQTKMCMRCYRSWAKYAKAKNHETGVFGRWVMKNRKTS